MLIVPVAPELICILVVVWQINFGVFTTRWNTTFVTIFSFTVPCFIIVLWVCLLIRKQLSGGNYMSHLAGKRGRMGRSNLFVAASTSRSLCFSAPLISKLCCSAVCLLLGAVSQHFSSPWTQVDILKTPCTCMQRRRFGNKYDAPWATHVQHLIARLVMQLKWNNMVWLFIWRQLLSTAKRV